MATVKDMLDRVDRLGELHAAAKTVIDGRHGILVASQLNSDVTFPIKEGDTYVPDSDVTYDNIINELTAYNRNVELEIKRLTQLIADAIPA